MASAPDPDRETYFPESELVATVLERPDAPDRCTIYPRGRPEHVQSGQWIAAEKDGFASLVEMR